MGKHFTKKSFTYKPKEFISSYELSELIEGTSQNFASNIKRIEAN